jgi:hypothetical protein
MTKYLIIIISVIFSSTLLSATMNPAMAPIISYLLSDSEAPVITTPKNLLTTSSNDVSCMNLKWSDTSYNETIFELERKNGSTWSRIATLGKDSENFIDCSNITHPQNYCYRVRAKNSSLASEYSNISCSPTHLWWKDMSLNIRSSAVSKINGLYQSGSQFSFGLLNKSSLSDLKVVRLIVKNAYGTKILSQSLNEDLAPSVGIGHTLTLSSNQRSPLVISYVVENKTTKVQQKISTITENRYPVANAGADQVIAIQSTVHLDATKSHTNSGTLSYIWSLNKPSESSAILSNKNASMPTFNADVLGTYTAYLMVSNGTYSSVSDSVTIYVTQDGTLNNPPIARAGYSKTIKGVKIITLDGSSSSDRDGDDLTYQWSFVNKPEGSSAVLSGTSTSKPTFTADVNGIYVIRLIVNDTHTDSNPDNITITYSNSAPVVNAGDDHTVATGTNVTLDASLSRDDDGDSLEYIWQLISKPQGSSAVLSATDTVAPSFTADISGSYSFSLSVSDGILSSPTENITITATQVPVAVVSGNSEVARYSKAYLDGSGSSDADSDTLTYHWTLSKPYGSSSQFSDTSAISPSFIPDRDGVYTATLTVHDGHLSSNEASLSINVTTQYFKIDGRMIVPTYEETIPQAPQVPLAP